LRSPGYPPHSLRWVVARQPISLAVAAGLSCELVVAQFQVSNSSIIHWVRRLRATGSFAGLPMGGQKPFVSAKQFPWLCSPF
jgi:transposase